MAAPLVGVVMGSKSDWGVMTHTVSTLESLNIPHEARVMSAHRTPDVVAEYAAGAEARGIEGIIAAAGGAAHLPGMIAALTHIPVLGVPVKSRTLSGWDSLLSIVQMPKGVAVGTLAIGAAGAWNAGLLAAQMLAAGNPEQPVEDTPEKVTQITSSPRDVDPYTASLAVHIGKELGKRPVPSSRSVTEPVSSQLELKLLPSGALTGAKVTKSTGFNDIDRAIYQAALLASPYPKPPEEYSGRKQFRVELIFAPERL